MRLFAKCYQQVLNWSRHRYAPRYLAALGFSESVFFPIPTDVLLAPMVLGTPNKAWLYAMIASISSVIGAIAGYFLGYFAFQTLALPMIHAMGYTDAYARAVGYFDTWGIWVILITGFTPIPYKVFTISAGALSMMFFPFIVASLIGRSARFYLVSAVVRWGGQRYENKLLQYIDHIGWTVVVLIIIGFGLYLFLK